MADSLNRQRSKLLSEKVTGFFALRSRWAEPSVQALRLFREQARKHRWPAFLFGGVPRTFWLYGPATRVRDFDVVVDDAAFREMHTILGENIVKLNRFGGAKLLINGIDFDVWPLSSTWAYQKGLVSRISFESLPLTTFLNIDSIAVELAPQRGKPRRVFDAGFFHALNSRRLDIQLRENPFPDLATVRALRMAQSLGFKLSRVLAEYISEVLRHVPARQLEITQKNHFGSIFFSSSDLIHIQELLFTQLASVENKDVILFKSMDLQTEFWESNAWSSVLGMRRRRWA